MSMAEEVTTRPIQAPVEHFQQYAQRLAQVMTNFDWTPVARLADEFLDCWKTGRQVFIAGNGGSAGNAVHLANDFICGLSKDHNSGIRVTALPANPAVITCLANDEGYDKIFSLQLGVLANPGDVLLVFSGSGNSPNILEALDEAKRLDMHSYAVLGFDGGKAKNLADTVIHFELDDMQIAEDGQLILGHMIMQWLNAQQDTINVR